LCRDRFRGLAFGGYGVGVPDEVHGDRLLRSPPAVELEGAVADRGLLIYERVVPAVPVSVGRIRNELIESLVWHDLAADRHDDIALVVNEAASNAVVHAYCDTAPGPLYAAATLRGDSLTVWISDSGRGLLPRRDSPGLGLGMPLMSRLCDNLESASDADAGGTCVTATFERATPAAESRTDTRHLPAPGSGRRELLLDYLQALRAANTALRQDTEALLAQAELAVARARRQIHERAERRENADRT
jgi:anti-sigma regulatory factor (Ser/Thr protein kinase)